METKVALYDADDKLVGETFIRRARQLVAKQRASWIDDTQTAIRFAADAPLEGGLDMISEPSKDDRLIALAKRLIWERRRFILHTLILVPGYISIIFVINVMLRARNGNDFVFFLWGAWTMAYVMHAWMFIRPRLRHFQQWEGRSQRVLEMEVDRLKRMGYRD